MWKKQKKKKKKKTKSKKNIKKSKKKIKNSSLINSASFSVFVTILAQNLTVFAKNSNVLIEKAYLKLI